MAQKESKYNVMISYKWGDSRDFAEELQKYLQENNITVYRDATENKGGQDITEQWQQAIRTCQVFVPILSQNYHEGTPENEFFFNKYQAQKPIVPVVMGDFKVKDSYGLKGTLQLRETNYEEKDSFLRKILDAVKEKLTGGTPGKVCSEGADGKASPEDFGQFTDQPQLADLMDIVGADCHVYWRNIGRQLNLKTETLDGIQANTAGQPNAAMERMSEVFVQWRHGMTCEYSWKTLAEVLCSSEVNRPDLLEKMYNKLIKLR